MKMSAGNLPQPSSQQVTLDFTWSSDPQRLSEQLIDREWLVAFGNGGYASGTVGGICTRRHHGLLVAALPAPTGRALLLSQLWETVEDDKAKSTRLWGVHHHEREPQVFGQASFEGFRLELGLPVWTYRIDSGIVEKRLVPQYRENSVAIGYRLVDGQSAIQLQLRPMLQFRGHNDSVATPVENGHVERISPERFKLSADNAPADLHCAFDSKEKEQMTWLDEPLWVEDCEFRIERDRGYDHVGTLWSPGVVSTSLEPGETVALRFSTEQNESHDGSLSAMLTAESARRQGLLERAEAAGRTTMGQHLTLAADQFLIRPQPRTADRNTDGSGSIAERLSVIAGYPWFTDWGRDTMIALPGLTMATQRHEEARQILRTFASYVRDGLLPNLFPEGGQEGMYHTADATLWFFEAIGEYTRSTEDDSLLEEIMPKLDEVFEAHLHGTRFGIKIDHADGLLSQGEDGVQLTWMDAKVADWVVTPRRGKAVEINALWFNALQLYFDWLERFGRTQAAERVAVWRDKAKVSFNRQFWYPEGGYLLDTIDSQGGSDAALRPNQLFAISLTHPILDTSRWQTVVTICRDHLLTPVGLRSLAPQHPDYHGSYVGDVWARDAAYHQGTVWSWLIGPFLASWMRTFPKDLSMANRVLEGFEQHLGEAGLGQISEVFDGDAPHQPGGCFAQAWSVAELLRCITRRTNKKEGP